MNLFKITNQVNKNKQLTFAQKAILNQIISYHLNKLPFVGTNEWLSNHWGCDIATIKRIISFLKMNGYVTVKNKRKKHTEGNQTWYNKRYITPILENIITSEVTVESEEIPVQESPTIELVESTAIEFSNETIITTQDIDFSSLQQDEEDELSDDIIVQAFARDDDFEDELEKLTKEDVRKKLTSLLMSGKYTNSYRQDEIRDYACNASKYTDENYLAFYKSLTQKQELKVG